MERFARRLFIALCFGLAALVPPLALADFTDYNAAAASSDPDFAAAVKAIDAKDWNKAVDHLTKSASRNDKNADVFNLLGYSERNRGNMDAAFKAYDRALKLDPKHKGAHEYVGEAYLKVNNVTKAEEHLASLDKICTFGCDEYKKLKSAIAQHKQTQAKK